MKHYFFIFFLCISGIFSPNCTIADESSSAEELEQYDQDDEDDDYLDDEDWLDEEDEGDIYDPLSRWNYAMFTINDRLYFWILKPVAKRYSKGVPEKGRRSVRNFFRNITVPVRLVNCLLQRKFKSAGSEIAIFLINSTIGYAGFMNPAEKRFHFHYAQEDLGQTFGFYGLGDGFYLVLPLIGPSSLRDGIGLFGDGYLSPINYLSFPWAIGVRAFSRINETSLRIGEYEHFKEITLSPYDALRNAYFQRRQGMIKK